MAARYGDAVVKLDGAVYTVRYGNLAWDELKRAFGVDTEAACLVRGWPPGPDRFVLLRAGLSTYHPEITLEETRRLYDGIPEEGPNLLSAAGLAIEMAMPELKKLGASPNGRPAAPPRPNATRSSRKR